MKTHIFRHAGVALASTLVLSSLALTPIGAPVTAQAAPATVKIDTSSKTSVQNAYLNVYLKNVDVANGWTGNLSKCTAGTASADAVDATVNMVNYYRALAGLPPVKENAQATKNAQQAALVMAANGNLNHYPPDSWTCMSTTAYTAAGNSNLGLGYSTTGRTVEGWMSDNGTPSVGHRNAILYPPLGQVGTGIAGTGTPWVNGYPSLGYALEWMDSSLWTNTRTGTDVAWPSAGYFPSQNLPASGYWSFSRQNTNFNGGTGQTVTVTKKAADGTTTTIPVTGVSSSQDEPGWVPDSILVWSMPKISVPASGVDTYTVKISGAVNTSYDVKVFTVQQKVTVDSVSISGARTDGTAAIGTKLTAKASGVTPSDATLTYTWYNGTTKLGTGSTYTAAVADEGATLTVKVTGSKDGWDTSDTVTSSKSVTIDSLLPLTGTVQSTDGTSVKGVVVSYNNVACNGFADITSPDISGTVKTDAKGAFSFGTMSEQCYEIGVSSPTGLIVNSNGSEGGPIGYSQAGATGYSIFISQVAFDNITIPKTVAVGKSLTGTLGTYQPDTASFTYQWYRDDEEIDGATDISYTATADDVDHLLKLSATASSGTGQITRTSSTATVTLGAPFTFTPPINGTPVVGQTLTTSIDSVPKGWTPTYQWLRDDGEGDGATAIDGATTDSYILVADDLNTTISVQVVLTQDGYKSSTNTSGTVDVKAILRTVTFDAQNGTDKVKETTADGGTVALPDAPAKDGYTFDGWFQSDGTAFTEKTPVAADITVTAKWTKETVPPVTTYTVTYDANGGTGTMTDTTAYTSGSKAQVKDNGFTREGYTFNGWNTAANGKGTQHAAADSITIKADVTLYAQWTKETVPPVPPVTTYTVTYKANGGTGTMTDTTAYTSGSKAQVKDNGFTRDGYTFTGWNTAKDGKGTQHAAADSITIKADVTLYAQWTKETVPPVPPVTTYTVTYDANGGTGTMTDTTAYTSGSKAKVQDNGFTRDGYTFTGWNTAKDGKGTSCDPGNSIKVTADVTLFAQWQKNAVLPGAQYTVTYDGNGGTGKTYVASYNVGTQATAADNEFTREGYTFVGWNTAKDGTGTGYSTAAVFDLSDNVTLYAQWTANTPENPATPANPANPANPTITSGGTSANSSMLLLATIGLVLAGAVILRLRKTI